MVDRLPKQVVLTVDLKIHRPKSVAHRRMTVVDATTVEKATTLRTEIGKRTHNITDLEPVLEVLERVASPHLGTLVSP